MIARLFGKMPTHGDFVARGLTPAERNTLDPWLAGSLDDARHAMGDAFADAYDAAPPWRFVLPGAGSIRAGALAASLDSVGRRFPLYLAVDTAPETAETAAEGCEALIYDSFAYGWDADRLAAAAGAMVPETGMSVADAPAWWTPGNEDFPPARLSGERPPLLVRHMLHAGVIG